MLPISAMGRFQGIPQQLHYLIAEGSLRQLAGRFAEISGSNATAALTLACGLVLDAQKCGEPVSWTTSTESAFYPPDAAQLGIDLVALVVVRVPKADAIYQQTFV